MSGTLRRLNSGSAGIVDAARCPACKHPARIHNPAGCVFGPCECVVARAELMPDAPRLDIPDVPVTPATPHSPRPAVTPESPAPEPVTPRPHWDPPKLPPLSAPAGREAQRPLGGLRLTDKARATLASDVDRTLLPAGPPPDWEPHVPSPDYGPHTPGAGWARAKAELGDIVPDLTEEDERRADEILAAAARQPLAVIEAPRRTHPRPATSALGCTAVVGEGDAVGEVTAAAGATGAAVTDPPELDLTPFLSAAYHAYSAWYCARCFQRRHDPGACPDCRKPLKPVHVVVVPRSLV